MSERSGFLACRFWNKGLPRFTGALVGVYAAAGALPAWGQCDEEQKLTALDAAAGDQYGYSVSVSGDTAVVGSYLDDDAGAASGAAYVYVRTGGVWTQQQKLTAFDAAGGDQFGISVSINGDTVVVGANENDDAGSGSGSAYVYVRSGGIWAQQQKLTALDAALGDRFGISVFINGDTVVVGANEDDDSGSASGSAYIFIRTGLVWTQQQKLTALDAALGDRFGLSVSVSGDTVVVGSSEDDDLGGRSGSAYIFVRSGTVWTQQQKLNASDGAADDYFGWSVGVSGDTAIAAAVDDDDAGPSSGSAYVFVRSGVVWTQQQKLTASDATAVDTFGWSVSVSGNKVVVGAALDDDGGTNSGSAYVFVRSMGVWTQVQKLIASDAAGSDQFGLAVSVSGDLVVVGAYLDDNAGGSDAGSAYVFDCSPPCTPPDCSGHGTCDLGTCSCNVGYVGAACDQCAPNFYDYPSCTFCQAATTCSGHGTCNMLGGCDCDTGWIGSDCGTSDAIPTVSQWGAGVMTLLLVTMGTIVYRRRLGTGRAGASI